MGFSNLKQQRVRVDRTRRYLLDCLPPTAGKTPVLLLRVANEVNEAYSNAAWKILNESRARTGAGKITQAFVDADRADDARLFTDHVVVGWEDVFEDDGTAAPFTPDKVFEFLTAVSIGYPNDYDAMRRYAKSEANFRDAPLPSTEAVGKG